MNVILGSRGSALAMAQAQFIAEQLRHHHPTLQVEIKSITTKGDKITDLPIWKIGDKGLFVKELETALIQKEIDLAVHSVKDLPAILPKDLTLAAFPKREDPSDVLLTQSNVSWDKLPEGATIGTSALRRQSQLLHHRPDLQVKMLRGNVDTRLRKLDEGGYFGIIVAKAGLSRLGIARGSAIPTAILLPSPGQGALAIEARKSDSTLLDIARSLNDATTESCVAAERSFLLRMEGGCQVPLGALATRDGDNILLEGFLGTPDGKNVRYEKLQCNLVYPSWARNQILTHSLAFREQAPGRARSFQNSLTEVQDLGTRLAERILEISRGWTLPA